MKRASPAGRDERRMQVRAYNYWASLLGRRRLPAIGDLDPRNLPDFGPFSVLLDFTTAGNDPAIRFLGRKLAGEHGEPAAIGTLGAAPAHSLLARIADHCRQSMDSEAPVRFEAEFVNPGARTVLYRGILLPFASADGAIGFIFGVINWKEVIRPAATRRAGPARPIPGHALPARAMPNRPQLGGWADGPTRPSHNTACDTAYASGHDPAPGDATLPAALADRLRALGGHGLDALCPTGREFTLLVARRLPHAAMGPGAMLIVGEAGADGAMIEQAARQLLG